MSRGYSRNDYGLTTLEWLLIVAAVAGLAALAVVLVQNVVDDTAEQLAANNARVTAAQVAAKAITDDSGDNQEAACNRLNITYSDALPEQDPPARAVWNGTDTCEIINADEAVRRIALLSDDSTKEEACRRIATDYSGKKGTWDSSGKSCSLGDA